MLAWRPIRSALSRLGQRRTLSSEPRPLLHVVGLAGSIASGKSHAARYLMHMGASLIDCDRLVHVAYEDEFVCGREIIRRWQQDRLLQPKNFHLPESIHGRVEECAAGMILHANSRDEMVDGVCAAFGQDVLNDSANSRRIDRAALSQAMFECPPEESRRRLDVLNRIVHPFVHAAVGDALSLIELGICLDTQQAWDNKRMTDGACFAAHMNSESSLYVGPCHLACGPFMHLGASLSQMGQRAGYDAQDTRDAHMVVIEAPILLRPNRNAGQSVVDYCQEVWVVHTDINVQVERVMSRALEAGIEMTEEQARARVEQAPANAWLLKQPEVTVTVDSSGSYEDTRALLREVVSDVARRMV